MKNVLGSTLLASLLWFLVSPPAHAVDIEPMRLEQSLRAGTTYSGSFELTNMSSFFAEIAIATDEYRYIFSEGTIPPPEGKKALPSCRTWLTFEKTNANLNPGESCTVNFLIKVPADAREEHLCAVLFDEKRGHEEAPPASEAGSVRVHLTPRVSIPVYISIQEAQKIAAEITAVEVSAGPKKQSADFNITVKNTGTVHIRPLGTLVIFDEKGEVAKNIPTGKPLPIFAGYSEVIPVGCPSLGAGTYTAVVTMELSRDTIIQKKIGFVKKGGKTE